MLVKKNKKYILGGIFVVVSIILLTIFAISASAEDATAATAKEIENEKHLVKRLASVSRGLDANDKLDKDTLEELLNKYTGSGVASVTEKSSDTLAVTFVASGREYEVNINSGPMISGSGAGLNSDSNEDIGWTSPSEIFDEDRTNVDRLHIGDFVNYDAGVWTAAEISAIQTGEKESLVTANGTTDLPTEGFQFGGFAAGSSRNGTVTPPYDSSYDYVKDASTGNALTGWRVFDIEGNNVTLISAGAPEAYYHPYSTNSAYMSEYILTGNVNSAWDASYASRYQKRNWDNYVNAGQKAQSATVLTKSRLDAWYSKYIETGADINIAETLQKIYATPYLSYQNLIDNYSYYWICGYNKTIGMGCLLPDSRVYTIGSRLAMGVRVLVSLSSNIKFTETKTGTITVTGGNTSTYGGNQTYNCWNIQ